MTPFENLVFGTDVWWISLTKVGGIFSILLLWCLFNVWFERRVLGRMQNRQGPKMNGPFGLPQAMGDGLKLVFKEEFIPAKTDSIIFNLAPMLAGVAAFTSWSVIPLGGEVTMFGQTTRLQLTDLPVSSLFIIAVASIGIYGIVMAGWASSGSYSLLGGLRSSAQMISYEIAMGLSLVAVFMFSGSMSTADIVESQTLTLHVFGYDIGIPGWYSLLLIPSFIIYVIAMFGESNRLPFDLPECESELVSGYSTEYTGFRYGMYYLAEYINMQTLSAVCVTLFLGGYTSIWPVNVLAPGADEGWWGLLWFFGKCQLVIFFFVWTRGALPRFRYDQFMNLGWKWLIPISLVWIMMVAVVKAGMQENWFQGPVFTIVTIAVVAVLLAVILFSGTDEEEPEEAEPEVFDAFAGGYPVPPMPGQKLPELAEAVSGTGTSGTGTVEANPAITKNGADA